MPSSLRDLGAILCRDTQLEPVLLFAAGTNRCAIVAVLFQDGAVFGQTCAHCDLNRKHGKQR